MRLKNLCLMAILGATLFAVQLALAVLPNIELVSLCTILFTLVFGKKIWGILAVFLLLEGLFYGFGSWWLMYLYIWPLLALLTYLFRGMKKNWQWALFAGLFGLAFGSLCSLVYFPLGGLKMMLAFMVSGFFFDLLHAGGNLLLTFMLYNRLRRALEFLRDKIFTV